MIWDALYSFQQKKLLLVSMKNKIRVLIIQMFSLFFMLLEVVKIHQFAVQTETIRYDKRTFILVLINFLKFIKNLATETEVTAIATLRTLINQTYCLLFLSIYLVHFNILFEVCSICGFSISQILSRTPNRVRDLSFFRSLDCFLVILVVGEETVGLNRLAYWSHILQKPSRTINKFYSLSKHCINIKSIYCVVTASL